MTTRPQKLNEATVAANMSFSQLMSIYDESTQVCFRILQEITSLTANHLAIKLSLS